VVGVGSVAFDVGDEFGGGLVFGVELGGGARFKVGPCAEKFFEAVEDVEEGGRDREADGGDAELGTEFEELGNAVAAGEVGGDDWLRRGSGEWSRRCRGGSWVTAVWGKEKRRNGGVLVWSGGCWGSDEDSVACSRYRDWWSARREGVEPT
jgi:hypothetical protein